MFIHTLNNHTQYLKIFTVFQKNITITLIKIVCKIPSPFKQSEQNELGACSSGREPALQVQVPEFKP
jgi:hypothetical protein